MMDTKGNLYGTTYSGGATGNGVVFELAHHKHKGTWAYRTLWGFTGGNDGGVPAGSLTMDSAGNLYGYDHAGRHRCRRHSVRAVAERQNVERERPLQFHRQQ